MAAFDKVPSNPYQAKADEFRQQMASDFASLQQHALQYRIDYQPVDVCRGFHQVLLPFLLKRNKSR